LTPEHLDELVVYAYGAKSSLVQLAAISSMATNMLQLNIYDDAIVHDVVKTLENSNLNLQLRREGKVITCTQVGGNTKEQKTLVIGKVKHHIDGAKLHLRKIRADGIDHVCLSVSSRSNLTERSAVKM
jgi:ribosome recycling factor